MDHTNLCLGCMEDNGSSIRCTHCGYQKGSGPESAHHLQPGTVLINKYLIGRVLGQGGFGITYLAWDTTLELKLAIKEFFPMGLVARSAGSSQIDIYVGEQKEQFAFGIDRFLGEAKTLARFSEHPNIVTVRDFFPSNSTAYMVMNYIEGQTFGQYLKLSGGRITFSKALAIMMPVMDALREVHQTGFMHRDVSPDNIFIRNDGMVVLIDFGAARLELQNKSRSMSVIMKVGYSPEEQYRSKGLQGPWTDIYALAATIYRGITGEVPPESMDRLAEDTLFPPSACGVEITEIQEQALMKALEVRAKDRYQTVKEFQEALVFENAVITSAAEILTASSIIITEGTEAAAQPIVEEPKFASQQAQPAILRDYIKPLIRKRNLIIGIAIVALVLIAALIYPMLVSALFVAGYSQTGEDVPADDPAEEAAAEEPGTIIIAAKGWSESMTLGYMAALLIEANTVHSVDTSKINMGPTEILHPALVEGQIDLYPEYTGTAWMVVLAQELITDRTEIFEKSRDAYMEQFGIAMLEPLGFNNTFAIAMTKERAEELGVTKLSDLAGIPDLIFVGDNTTFTRPDVYPGMAALYNFEMEQGIVDTAFFYEALAQGQGDVTTCFGTDGRLKQYGFVVLEDDKNFFPPYDAIYVLRPGLLDEYPSIADALAPLLGSIDEETMIELNHKVEVEMEDPEDVAREYLESVGLL